MELQVIRKVDPDQLDDLRHLLDAAKDHDHHSALGEHKWLDLVHGGRPGFAGVVASDGDKAIGYAHISGHAVSNAAHWGLEIVVHPQHRDRGVERALVERALEVVKEAGGGHLHLWVFQPGAVHDELASALGLQRGRDLLHMRIDLPISTEPNLPSGIRIRAFEPGRDDAAWLELNNRAFLHHPEQGAWDAETFERRMQQPWFDAQDLLLAVDDAGLAGSNWTKLDHDEKVGEIYVIAVDPSRHGSGLGKALSIAGLRHMADRGMRHGSLYVDSDNAKALAMYRKIGFDEHHADRAYVIDV
jgi:mycothiol synthase